MCLLIIRPLHPAEQGSLAAGKTPVVGRVGESKTGNGSNPVWGKTAGPPGLQVNVIYKAGNVLYAGTATQGVHKSTDNGQNWFPANAGIERAQINDIIVSGPNVLVAATARDCPGILNVYKSTDGGATWNGTAGLNGRIVNSFAIKGGVIYAGVAHSHRRRIRQPHDRPNL